MGKLVVTEHISLDGVIEDPGGADGSVIGGWTAGRPINAGLQFKYDEICAADVQLFGRVTYQSFAAAWPAMQRSTGEYGKRINEMPKVVVSTTLTQPTWRNTSIIARNVVEEVQRLKQRYVGDVLVAGSATLAEFLRINDLVDEYRLMVHPVVLGRGKRLFTDPGAITRLSLVESLIAGPDVPLLIFRPVR